MFKKRYIVVAVGVVSVLLVGLFVNNVILAQSGGEYDPWLDHNEDGTINVNDLYPLGQSYGSSGDPAKNVTIKHSYYEEEIYFGGIWPGENETLEFDLTGFRQVSYCIRWIPTPFAASFQCDIAIGKFSGDQTVGIFDWPTGGWVPLPRDAFYYGVLEISGPTLRIRLFNSDPTEASAVRVVVYMTT